MMGTFGVLLWLFVIFSLCFSVLFLHLMAPIPSEKYLCLPKAPVKTKGLYTG